MLLLSFYCLFRGRPTLSVTLLCIGGVRECVCVFVREPQKEREKE